MTAIAATIDRRVLLTFTLDPEVAQSVLPAPFRPDLSFGSALGGLCLIRVTGLRPPGLPSRAGLTVENVVHRIAVEWDTPDGIATGTYVLRRDTDSSLAALAGGRVFPGRQHRATFGVVETPGRASIAAQSIDGAMSVAFDGEESAALPSTSVFTGADSASAFFRCDRVAYSASRRHGEFDGLRMDSARWEGTPMRCSYVQSSVFEDRSVFPKGSVSFDHALLMRSVDARWIPLPRLTPSELPPRVPALAELA
jgi:hypothetical protein